jgi:hypothetical protein
MTEYSTASPALSGLFNHRALTTATLATYHDQGCLLRRSSLKPTGRERRLAGCMGSFMRGMSDSTGLPFGVDGV